MRGGQWTQLLVLLLAIGAPMISWIFGKLREQAELKKARDAARRQHEDSLRSTQLTSRSAPGLSPESQRERERQDLAARRQAQLRELRQRQYERAARPGTVVVRGPGAPGRPAQAPQRPAPGPLRPGVPAPPTVRRGPQIGVPPRPASRRPTPPAVRPIPTLPVRRAPVAQPERPRVEERRPEPGRGQIAATEIGQGHAGETLRSSRGVGSDVRDMLIGPDGRPRPRADLAKAFALTEVLSSPISLREQDQLSWNRM